MITSARGRWPAVLALTVGILRIGLLTPIAGDFGLPAGTAGWIMTVPGVAPAVAVLFVARFLVGQLAGWRTGPPPPSGS